MILTKNGPQGLICPHAGPIYMYISIIFKHLSSETTLPIKAKFYVKHLKDGVINVYINNPGHMTKMAARPIYGKNLSKIFSGTSGQISRKLGLKHRWLKYYNVHVYINHDPVMTLTQFMARSTWVANAFEWE